VPSYDPRHWQAVLKKDPINGYNLFLNPAVSKQYEPGSTFKAVLSAIGLDSGSFTQYTTIYDPGKINVDGITIQNWCTNYCSFGGNETLQTMLHYSSNIAATRFSEMIPDVVFYKYLDNFGFGRLSGVDLAGEIPGEVRKPTDTPPKPVWVRAYKDTTAYGQGIAVTPLQMTNAYSAIANGGRLMVPHVAESYTLDGKTTMIPPVVKDQVISADTSALVTNLLVNSVIGGEACRALVPGYDVAAKTGTTTISLNSPLTIASTLAFGPTNMPVNQQFVVLMELNTPTNPYGSETAAPAVHTILQNLFNYYHRPPDQGTLIQPTTGRCVAPLSSVLGPN
jgi:cell division protein FtsI/penicillin-binding protein 2